MKRTIGAVLAMALAATVSVAAEVKYLLDTPGVV